MLFLEHLPQGAEGRNAGQPEPSVKTVERHFASRERKLEKLMRTKIIRMSPAVVAATVLAVAAASSPAEAHKLRAGNTASAGHGSYALWVGERLNPGQYLATGSHLAKMGNNGGFTLHKNGVQCWSTGTAGRGDYRSYITMQSDGNLVIYSYPGGPALWASGTTAFRGGHLEIQSGGVIPLTLAITDSRTFNFRIATCY